MSYRAALLLSAWALAACEPARDPIAPDTTPEAEPVAFNNAGGWDTKVTGGGQWSRVGGLAFGEFQISAHAFEGGANPRGHAAITADQSQLPAGHMSWDFSGAVTCVHVAGNRATIGFRVDEGTLTGGTLPYPVIGSGMILTIEDNGSPRGGTPTDRLTNSGFFQDGNNLNCVAQLPHDTPFLEPIKHGNIVLQAR